MQPIKSTVITRTLALTLLFYGASFQPAQADDNTNATPSIPHDMQQTLQIPTDLRMRFLAHMRQNFGLVSDLQSLLAAGDFEQAADVAENKLGLKAMNGSSNPISPNTAQVSDTTAFPRITPNMHAQMLPYMPSGMRAIARNMHQAASHFAEVSRAAAATKDYPAALSALSAMTSQCVACHAQYTTEPQR